MSNYETLRDWLDELVDTEFRDVMRGFLTPEQQTRLPESVQSINRGDFLGYVQQKKRLDDLEKYLGSHYAERSEKEEQAQPLPAPQRLPFTNRENELAVILDSYAPAYYLVDAPAGYGKTELLKELTQRFKERGWDCAYVSVDEKSTQADLATALADKLQITSLLSEDKELPWSLRLCGALQWKRASTPQAGLALLIDFEKKPKVPVIQEVLQEFIPTIQACLRALQFFASRHNRLRIILAGRHLAARPEIRATLTPFKILRLSPFNYDIIQASARGWGYLVDHDEESIKQLSAHLLYLTGGHPGCIAQIVEVYDEKMPSPDLFLAFYSEMIWKSIVRQVVNEIRDGISQSTKELHKLLETLSVFRYVDYFILKRLIEEQAMSQVYSEYDLANELTATYLLDWKDRVLRDGITRRLLAIGLRHEIPEEFPSLCRQAQTICAERWRQSEVQRAEIWLIEYLFQSLQQHANAVEDPRTRDTIRQEFLNEQVPQTLQMFIQDRNILAEQWLVEQAAIIRTIEEDWEFRFTINYYLRESQYTDQPYRELQQQIDRFFAERSDALSRSRALGGLEVA